MRFSKSIHSSWRVTERLIITKTQQSEHMFMAFNYAQMHVASRENCQNESVLMPMRKFLKFSLIDFDRNSKLNLKPHRGEMLDAFETVGCESGRCECCWMPAVPSISSVFIWMLNCSVDISLHIPVNLDFGFVSYTARKI